MSSFRNFINLLPWQQSWWVLMTWASEIISDSHWSSQSNSVRILGRWWTERARCALKPALLSERWCVSPATRVTSWKDPVRSPAMEETPAPPNGVTAVQNVSVSPSAAVLPSFQHSAFCFLKLLFSCQWNMIRAQTPVFPIMATRPCTSTVTRQEKPCASSVTKATNSSVRLLSAVFLDIPLSGTIHLRFAKVIPIS